MRFPCARFLFALLLGSIVASGQSPVPDDRGAAATWQAIQRAQTGARVLYITAHPDDEDAGTLAWLARGQGAQVMLLSITRGEAGANVITGDFFDALGALRELELEKAAAFYGVVPAHTSFKDFGFSKNVAETWRNWNKAELAAEVQRLVQQFKPHIVMGRFHGSPRDGHGHHTAAGEITKLAFEESARGPWIVKKLYTGNWNEQDAWTVKIPVEEFNPILGRTYLEIGQEGYRWHRSQGMDRFLSRMPSSFQLRGRYYKLEGSRVGPAEKETSVFDRLGDGILPPPALRQLFSEIKLQDTAAIRAIAAKAKAEAGASEWAGKFDAILRTLEPAPVTPPAALADSLSVRFSTDTGILPVGQNRYQATVILRAFQPVKGRLMLTLPGELKAEPAEAPFVLEREGDEIRLPFTINVPSSDREREIFLKAVARLDSGVIAQTNIRAVTAPGLATKYLRSPAEHQIRVVNVKVAPGLKLGYVMGSGDDVPDAIRQLGIPVDLLGAEDLASGDLSRYSTIVLGIRAYAVREDLKKNNGRLLEFAKNGGVLIVQYNTQEFDRNFGPYPYTMTARAEEISEENSPVRILVPDHPQFNTPNKISPADFDQWLEQRGSKFFMTWDDRYTPLLESNDTGQPPQRGGWLEAKYGRGLYVYCAYAWYRQLPAAVPGAVRLFANLISRKPD